MNKEIQNNKNLSQQSKQSQNISPDGLKVKKPQTFQSTWLTRSHKIKGKRVSF